MKQLTPEQYIIDILVSHKLNIERYVFYPDMYTDELKRIASQILNAAVQKPFISPEISMLNPANWTDEMREDAGLLPNTAEDEDNSEYSDQTAWCSVQ